MTLGVEHNGQRSLAFNLVQIEFDRLGEGIVSDLDKHVLGRIPVEEHCVLQTLALALQVIDQSVYGHPALDVPKLRPEGVAVAAAFVEKFDVLGNGRVFVEALGGALLLLEAGRNNSLFDGGAGRGDHLLV